MIVEPSGHDVAALDQPEMRRCAAAERGFCHAINKRASRIDYRARGHLALASAIAKGCPPSVGGARQRRALGPDPHLGTVFLGILDRQHHQPCVLDPAVGIFEPGPQPLLQHPAMRGDAQVDTLAARQAHLPGDAVVEQQSQTQHPFGPHARFVRHDEAQRPDDMRCIAQQHLAFAQALRDEPELVMLEIAQPAMDQLGAGR